MSRTTGRKKAPNMGERAQIKMLRSLLRWSLFYAEHSYGGFPPEQADELRANHRKAKAYLRKTAPKRKP